MSTLTVRLTEREERDLHLACGQTGKANLTGLDKISFEIQNSRNQAGGQMSAQTSMLHIRVDDDTKEQATVALSAMGLSMSDAVRLFLRRVVIDQAFPLELKVPNAETLAAMEESRAMMAKGRAGFATADELLADLEKNSQA